MVAPAQRLMYVTSSLTGDRIDKPFLLPGSIWQLKCFVARQHDETRMYDITSTIQLMKVPKRSSSCDAIVCKDLDEAVDAIDFDYMFILQADQISDDGIFRPWRDTILFERRWSKDDQFGDSFEYYRQNKDVLKISLGQMAFSDFVFAYYRNLKHAQHHPLISRSAPPQFNQPPHTLTRKHGSTEGAIKNVKGLWLCSGRDQVVEILTFEDDYYYHFTINAFGDWQDVLQGDHFSKMAQEAESRRREERQKTESRRIEERQKAELGRLREQESRKSRQAISASEQEEAIRKRQAARAASGCKGSIIGERVTFTSCIKPSWQLRVE